MIKTKTITERFDEKGRLYERQTEETLDIDGDGYYNGHIDEFDTGECKEDDCRRVCGGCDKDCLFYGGDVSEEEEETIENVPCSCTHYNADDLLDCISFPITDNIKLKRCGTLPMSKRYYIEINDTLRLIVEDGMITGWYEPLLDRILD